MKKMISTLFKAIALSMIQVMGDNKAILVSVADDLEYGDDNKPTGKVLGTKYEVICSKMKYIPLTVKVSTLPPIISQEQIDTATDPIWITFDGFAAHFYEMRGEIGISCKATKATLVHTEANKYEKNN